MPSFFDANLQAAVILMAATMLIDTALTDYPDDDARSAHAAQGMARIIETMKAPRPA